MKGKELNLNLIHFWSGPFFDNLGLGKDLPYSTKIEKKMLKNTILPKSKTENFIFLLQFTLSLYFNVQSILGNAKFFAVD